MIYFIESENTILLSRIELSNEIWKQKLDKFIGSKALASAPDLLDYLTQRYEANQKDLKIINDHLQQNTNTFFRLVQTHDALTISTVFLEMKNNPGKLIYWNDWDFIFQEINGEYFLWCYLGGIADIQREIKLSSEQVELYKEDDLAYINRLITDIKKINNSIEYNKAIQEKRNIL